MELGDDLTSPLYLHSPSVLPQTILLFGGTKKGHSLYVRRVIHTFKKYMLVIRFYYTPYHTNSKIQINPHLIQNHFQFLKAASTDRTDAAYGNAQPGGDFLVTGCLGIQEQSRQ